MRITRRIKVGNVEIGGGAPVVVQTMNKLPLEDVKGNIEQIFKTVEKGNELIRIALPDEESVKYFKEIVSYSPIPVIADIHFNWKLAIEAFKSGANCVRLNPGNFGSRKNLKEVILSAKDYGGCIRVGVNLGSLDKKIEKTVKEPHKAVVLSAFEFLKFFEDNLFFNVKVSLKTSSVEETIKAYEMFSSMSDYPLHIGLTEAGPPPYGTVKSSVALGYLLIKGIGDTIRVSLTAPPEDEVEVAFEILRSVGLRKEFPEIVSCPLCGRATFNFYEILKELVPEIRKIKKNIKVAIMGCEVNGPGEAKDSDIGIAFSKNRAVLFEKGKIVKKGEPEKIIDELLLRLKTF